jgi:hypothetical protein
VAFYHTAGGKKTQAARCFTIRRAAKKNKPKDVSPSGMQRKKISRKTFHHPAGGKKTQAG